MATEFDTRTVQLHLTDQCNLRCTYCYEDRAERSSRVMPVELILQIAERHMTEENEHQRIEFDLIGGEPLLAWDRIVALVEFLHSRRWPRDFGCSFSTNGTLLNDEIKAYMDQHACLSFGISIDGTPQAHNLNRCNSYDRMAQHLPWALERCTRMGHEKRVKMTIGPDTIPMIAESVAHLHRIGFDKVDANVPYENLWGDRLEPCLEEYARQLDALIPFYLDRPELEAPRLINLPLQRISKEMEGDAFPRWCGSGNPMICYDVEGHALPCHRFVPVSTGLSYQGPITFPTKSWEEVRNSAAASTCTDCPFLGACPSCMALNWLENGDVDQRTHWHCGFILLQLKASAKFTILRNSRQIAAAPENEESRTLISKLQAELDQALEIHEIFSTMEA